MSQNLSSNAKQAGYSLIELLVATGIMSGMIFLSLKSFNVVTMMSRNIEGSSAVDQETNLWMSMLRKNFLVSLYDVYSPPTKPRIEGRQLNQGGVHTYIYDVKLDDRYNTSATIFSVTNKCIGAPAGASSFLPHMKRSYLTGIMNSLGADPVCVGELAPLDCAPGETIYAEFTGGANRLREFPAMPKNSINWKQASGVAVVGMVCIFRPAGTDYTHVQMMAGSFDQRYRDNPDRSQAIRWKIRKMVIPPASNGNSQYIRD